MGAPLPSEAQEVSARSADGARKHRLAMVGNPNTGKTTLFNQLCGLRAKTANFPGTTTDARVGRCVVPTATAEGSLPVEVVDLPGTYRLHLDVPEARVCHEVLLAEETPQRPDAVLVVVDATNLARNLCLLGEVLASGLPVVVALNMVDLAQRRGLTLDLESLERQLGVPVVPVTARQGTGLDGLREAMARVLTGTQTHLEPELDRPAGDDGVALTTWADRVVAASVGGAGALGDAEDSLTERLDQTFTHPVLGLAVFAAVMGGLFWTVFALAGVPMDLIELVFERLGGGVSTLIPPGAVHDLVVDGILGGVAGTVVFLPQICLLFFLISLLEDTGYLARAAFVMDRVLCRFGLPGQAFVPLLSSHACAIPGILSTRLIPDRRDRLATILVAPLMSCSARLPVYVLLTSLLFKDEPLYAGLAFAGCYVLGAGVALLTALIARGTVLEGRSRPMVLELPTYKTPSLRTAVTTAAQQGWAFLEKAGTVILAICVVMWWLSAYPQSEPSSEVQAMRAQATAGAGQLTTEQVDTLLAEADALEIREAQANSFAGRLGHLAQPALAPLGYDWQLTVGVMTSFLAREVFVSTMAVLMAGEGDPAEDAGVLDRIRTATRDDGTPVFTHATAASLLVFFVLAMQCLPTLVVTRRESGHWRWAALQLVYMTGLAWILAAITYQGLLVLGVGG